MGAMGGRIGGEASKPLMSSHGSSGPHLLSSTVESWTCDSQLINAYSTELIFVYENKVAVSGRATHAPSKFAQLGAQLGANRHRITKSEVTSYCQ